MATVFARTPGVRNGAMRIPVVSRSRSVTIAIAVSMLSGSRNGASDGRGKDPNG